MKLFLIVGVLLVVSLAVFYRLDTPTKESIYIIIIIAATLIISPFAFELLMNAYFFVRNDIAGVLK